LGGEDGLFLFIIDGNNHLNFNQKTARLVGFFSNQTTRKLYLGHAEKHSIDSFK